MAACATCPELEQSMCRPHRRGPYMQLETKFLRSKIPVTVGSYFDDWRVTLAGSWTRARLSFLVMVPREKSDSTQLAPARNGGRPLNRI